jgi:pyrroloquinoline-quinone synthase
MNGSPAGPSSSAARPGGRRDQHLEGDPAMADLLSPDDFRAALEQAMTGRQAKDASFSQAWADGLLQRSHFARWAENHYHYVGPFADYLGYIYANAPDDATEAKDFLLQNMYEEELSDVRHTDLLIRFAEACGSTRERVVDPDNMNPVTRGLQGWCYAVAMREHFTVGTAALVVGLESQVPGIYRKQYPPLLEKYGFTEDQVEFFDLHITSDEVHGERGFQIVVDHATTPALQQRCLKLVQYGAEMRFSYTKALYDHYVAPDLAPSSV